MADRQVTGTGKDSDGTITSLCGAFGTQLKSAAISDIRNGVHRYFTKGPSGAEVDIIVVKGDSGNYLRTEPDLSKADNLQSLPDC
jgi:Protein of unknown function (DUF3892)